ncbi:MAG TPA: FAD-binding oxidoreductase [Candidatus Saccharimonadales bacterium]|nr:FAD-binding oxidoreductase [Candidatus Saccharimonadales bacterium]
MVEAEVLIVGGGCVGTSTAFRLANSGCKGVMLLEKGGAVASGASGKGSAIVNVAVWNATKPLIPMLLESIEIYQNFGDRIGGTCGYTQCGGVEFAGANREAEIKRVAIKEKELGADIKLLSADELKQLDPGVNTNDLTVFAYEPQSGYADSIETTNSFAKQAEKHGARLSMNTEVTKIRVENGRVKGVETNKGPVDARKVFVAANVWAPKLLRDIGINVPITPVRKQVCLYKLPKSLGRPRIVMDDFFQDLYFRPDGDYTLAGEIEKPGLPADMQNFPAGFETETAIRIGEKLKHRYPSMTSAINRGGYSGPYDVSADAQPILDQPPQIEGLYIALGFSGHGFRFSPSTGRVMSELIMNGKVNGVDVQEFRLSRFAEGKPIPLL